MNTLERIQYQGALDITGTWKGTILNKIYDELGWESLIDRRWSRRLFHFYRIQNNLTPLYLKDPIPSIRTHLFGSRSENVLNELRCKSKRCSNSFYPDSIRSRNKIGPELRNSHKFKSFKTNILALVSIFGIHDPRGIKWLIKLQVGLSPLYDHKLKHNFSDTPSDKCDVCKRSEYIEHFFLYCTRYIEARHTLLYFVQTLNINFEHLHTLC